MKKCHYALRPIDNHLKQIFKFRGMSDTMESLYKLTSEVIVENKNPVITMEKFLSLLTMKNMYIQTIPEYLQELKTNEKDVVLPGRTKTKLSHYRSDGNEFHFQILKQYKKFQKLKKDFAEKVILKMKQENKEFVNFNYFSGRNFKRRNSLFLKTTLGNIRAPNCGVPLIFIKTEGMLHHFKPYIN